MKCNMLLTAIAAIGMAGCSAHAQNSQKPVQTLDKTTVAGRYGMRHIELLKTGKHLETVTCRDYNLLDESYRPQAISYAANYGPHGHAHPTYTVTGVESLVPVIGASCRERPGDHFVGAVDRAIQAHEAVAQH